MEDSGTLRFLMIAGSTFTRMVSQVQLQKGLSRAMWSGCPGIRCGEAGRSRLRHPRGVQRPMQLVSRTGSEESRMPGYVGDRLGTARRHLLKGSGATNPEPACPRECSLPTISTVLSKTSGLTIGELMDSGATRLIRDDSNGPVSCRSPTDKHARDIARAQVDDNTVTRFPRLATAVSETVC